MNTEDIVYPNIIMKAVSGSHAYGTSTPTSDMDYRGVFVAPEFNIRTPFFPIEQFEDKSEEDTVYYELNKFMKLLVDQNPNIVELLWVNRSDIVTDSIAYSVLRSYNEQLLSSKIAFTTTGYAFCQLKRIKGHNKWINNPQQVEEPIQAQFVSVVYNATDNKEWNKKVPFTDFRAIHLGDNQYALFEWPGECWIDKKGKPKPVSSDIREMPVPLSIIVKVNMQHYQDVHENWKQYWEWKLNRNEKRSALEEQFGYDTKHAMHLVRLLRTGVEALEEGKIYVKRPDAEELLDIRNGKYTYEEIVEYAEGMQVKIDQLYKTTSLRKRVDLQVASKVIMQVQDVVWSRK